MNIGFFAPLVLAGAALIAAPWIIHRIRRPDRIPVNFSSLMFVPQTKREVVRRTKIEHWLLMLLRMLGLLLLCIAFSRPYMRAMSSLMSDDRPVRHLVLIDTSYSMQTLDWFDQAKTAANKIVESANARDAVGVAMFDESLGVLTAVHDEEDPDVGTKQLAIEAIDRVKVSNRTTDYRNALREAEAMLLAGVDPEDAADSRRILHIITDLQAVGDRDRGDSSWRVSPLIEADIIPIGTRPENGISIDAASATLQHDGRVQVRAKLRNWSLTGEAQPEVAFEAEAVEPESQIIRIAPAGSGQAVFTYDAPTLPTAITLSAGADALDIDNRYYLAWNPPRDRPVGMLAADGSSATFFDIAINGEGTSWALESISQEFDDENIEIPPVLILDGRSTIEETAQDAILKWMNDGGRILVTLSRDSATWPARLLEAIGVYPQEMRFEDVRDTQYAVVDWVNLDHRAFAAFRSPRLSDFTTIRFFNYVRCNVEDGASVIARFEATDDESEGDPAIIAASHGEGEAIVWMFDINLDTTTLPRTPRFVPMLFETLNAIGPVEASAASYTVGEDMRAPIGGGDSGWEYAMNGAEVLAFESSDADYDAPGHIRWRVSGEETWDRVASINLDPAESDPTRLSEPEFTLKFFSSNALEEAEEMEPGAATTIDADRIVRNEFGYAVIILLVLWFLAESVYAAVLSRKKDTDKAV